jgi:site-specific DNA recombinase
LARRVRNRSDVRRTSSLGRQIETDSDPEGIALPAQCKAITTRAKELGAVIVNEFTDLGKSAKSIEHRDTFREMIAYLKANRNVRYVIVYALSRRAVAFSAGHARHWFTVE